MTRPIKFRAWDGNSMIYATEGTAALDHDYQFSFWDGGWECVRIGVHGRRVVCGQYNDVSGQRDDGVLMQFTGLTDKNGKEIYEGDIVRREPAEMNEVGVVKFGYYNHEFQDKRDETHWDGGVGFYIEFPKYQRGMSHDLIHPQGGDMPPTNESVLEVIGNIHENPELVK